MHYLAVVCQAVIAVTFAVAAFTKGRSRASFVAFAASVRDLTARPRRVSHSLAVSVIVAEATVALLVVVPGLHTAGFVLALILLAAFTAALVRALLRGERPSCRCFGSASAQIGLRTVVRNLLLGAAAVTGAVAGTLADASSAGAVDTRGTVLAIVAGAVAAGLIVAIDDIVELFSPATSSVTSLSKTR